MGVRTILALHQFQNLSEDGMLHELDSGELISTPPTQRRHWKTEQKINFLLSRFVEQNPIGEVCPSDAGFALSRDPDTVRALDVAFLRKERLEKLGDAYVEGAPDLAVEVFSPTDSVPQLMRKVRQYLKAGALTVWVVYPERREVHVFEADGSDRILKEDQVLDSPALLPGFSVAVKDLFD